MFKLIRATSEAQWTEHFLTELAGVTKLVSKEGEHFKQHYTHGGKLMEGAKFRTFDPAAEGDVTQPSLCFTTLLLKL